MIEFPAGEEAGKEEVLAPVKQKFRRRPRRSFSKSFKRSVVRRIAHGEKVTVLAREHELSKSVIFNWRKKFGKNIAPETREEYYNKLNRWNGGTDSVAPPAKSNEKDGAKTPTHKDSEGDLNILYAHIGRLTVKVEWLKAQAESKK